MKLHEVTQDELTVEKDTGNEVHLKNPKSGVKTIIPKSPNKKGAISRDEKGEYVVDTNANNGKVEKLKVGSKVKVKPGNNKPNNNQTRNTNPGNSTGGSKTLDNFL